MATGKDCPQVDAQGRLVLPAELAGRFGLQPGARVSVDEGPHGLLLRRPITHLSRVYVEPLGRMSETTFQLVLDGLRSFRPLPLVFFGGFGEPLTHPDIFRMIREVKRLGTVVELITNGTLLDEGLVLALLESELDTLWVSVDGTADCGHAGAGADDELNGILSKVRRL